MMQTYNENTDFGVTTKCEDCLKSVTEGIEVSNPIKNRKNIYLLQTHNSLISYFNKYFEIISADTPERLLQTYRLRYEVYCKEGLIPGFDSVDYPVGLECDEYDEHSVHSLLMHKPSGLIAGTVRIILPDQDKIDTKLPLEKFAGDSFYTEIESLKGLSRKHLGEISRLILAPGFRRRRGENWHSHDSTDTPIADYNRSINFERRIFPLPVLGLFVSVVRMSIVHGLKYWYVGMDHRLEKLCHNLGINFRPISPILDYYGPCRGYLGYIPDIMKSIYCTNMSLWALLANDGMLIPRPNQLPCHKYHSL